MVRRRRSAVEAMPSRDRRQSADAGLRAGVRERRATIATRTTRLSAGNARLEDAPVPAPAMMWPVRVTACGSDAAPQEPG